MKRFLLASMLAVAAVASAPAAAAPAKKAAAPRDWTRTVVATPEGGFRVGNPQARTKVVEYGSLTCPHCRDFAAVGMPELLSQYVKNGRVSFEFRNFVRDPYDLTGALLTRCAGPANFFALTERIFATQDEWTGRVKPEVAAIQALPQNERIRRIASVSGLQAMAAKAGVPAARAKQCLNDPKAVDKLVEMRAIAVNAHGLKATPTFLIDGKASGARDWESLKPLLGAPGG